MGNPRASKENLVAAVTKDVGTEFQGLNRGEDEINLRSSRGRS